MCWPFTSVVMSLLWAKLETMIYIVSWRQAMISTPPFSIMTSCISLLQNYITMVEPADLFCKHNLQKGGVAKICAFRRREMREVKVTDKDFVVKWELRDRGKIIINLKFKSWRGLAQYQLKSIYTIDKWPCLWIDGPSASRSKRGSLTYSTDQQDEENKILVFFCMYLLSVWLAWPTFSGHVPQLSQIIEAVKRKNDSIQNRSANKSLPC